MMSWNKLLRRTILEKLINWDEQLKEASTSGDIERAKEALENGVDVTAEGNYAIGNASYHGHLEICKLLIKNEADVAANNNFAIRWTSANGHLDICQLLIEQGADVTADDNWAIRQASSNSHSDIVKLLCGEIIKKHPDQAEKTMTQLKPEHQPILKKALLNSKSIKPSGSCEMDMGL